jgi:hypothetical protein
MESVSGLVIVSSSTTGSFFRTHSPKKFHAGQQFPGLNGDPTILDSWSIMYHSSG